VSFYSFIRRATCTRIIDRICTSDGICVEDLIARSPLAPNDAAAAGVQNFSNVSGKRVSAHLLVGSNASDIFALRCLLRNCFAWCRFLRFGFDFFAANMMQVQQAA
jgi:hypothetical protein